MSLSSKPTLLITGATGFIGGSLARYFNGTPHYKVVATGRCEAKGQLLHSKGISFQSIDLTLEEGLSNFKTKPDLIIHAAGFAASWGAKKKFYDDNVLATKNLLEYALENNVKRFIYISSSSVYSSMKHQFDVAEDHLPEKFVGHYAQSKYQAERCVLDASRKGLPVIILRPRAVIGAGDTTVLPKLIDAHEQGRLRRINQNKVFSDITTIANLTEAVRLSLLSSPSANGKIFNITDGKPVQLWSMIDQLLQELNLPPMKGEFSWPMALMISYSSQAVSKLLNREPALSRYVVSLLGRSLTMNISKARNFLDYSPIQTTEQGVLEYVKYYKNRNLNNNGRNT